MATGAILYIDHIEAKPGSGTPRIKGKGVHVALIAHLAQDPEWTVQRICDNYDLTPGQVHAALSYYYDHREEIEAAIQTSNEALDRHFRETPEIDRVRQNIIERSRKSS